MLGLSAKKERKSRTTKVNEANKERKSDEVTKSMNEMVTKVLDPRKVLNILTDGESDDTKGDSKPSYQLQKKTVLDEIDDPYEFKDSNDIVAKVPKRKDDSQQKQLAQLEQQISKQQQQQYLLQQIGVSHNPRTTLTTLAESLSTVVNTKATLSALSSENSAPSTANHILTNSSIRGITSSVTNNKNSSSSNIAKLHPELAEKLIPPPYNVPYMKPINKLTQQEKPKRKKQNKDLKHRNRPVKNKVVNVNEQMISEDKCTEPIRRKRSKPDLSKTVKTDVIEKDETVSIGTFISAELKPPLPLPTDNLHVPVNEQTTIVDAENSTKMISSDTKRHTIGWSGGPGSIPSKLSQNPKTPIKTVRNRLSVQADMQPPYPNQAVSPAGVLRKQCLVKPRTASHVMTEQEAKRTLKRKSAVKLYAYHASQCNYNHDLLGLGKFLYFSLL